MNTIIKHIKTRRTALGLTQADLGHKLGLPQSHVSKIEQGVTDPRLSTLAEMARVLDAELILVPRELIGVVMGIVTDASPEEPMWTIDEEEEDL